MCIHAHRFCFRAYTCPRPCLAIVIVCDHTRCYVLPLIVYVVVRHVYFTFICPLMNKLDVFRMERIQKIGFYQALLWTFLLAKGKKQVNSFTSLIQFLWIFISLSFLSLKAWMTQSPKSNQNGRIFFNFQRKATFANSLSLSNVQEKKTNIFARFFSIKNKTAKNIFFQNHASRFICKNQKIKKNYALLFLTKNQKFLFHT